MNLSKAQVGIIVIILFHAVGLAGFFLYSFRPLFLRVVPLHLVLMLLVVGVTHGKAGVKFMGFGLLVYLLGFIGEWVGVHTQIIFGEYHYGTTLGPKLWDIPLTIGINWFLLVYGAGVLLQRSRIRNQVIRVILGAMLLVALDLLIEPVAIKFDYWQWAGGFVPLRNYIGWFVVSVIFMGLFEAFRFTKQTIVGAVLFLVQFVFFGLLHWAR